MKTITAFVCATLVAATATANPYTPNRIKYKDTGHQPATGRSGGASIEALAMIDKQGVAEVEITAGAPGTLEHIQVKTDRQTANYNAGAAAFVVPLAEAGRGTPVSILANVSGTDGSRTGVVEVNDSVVLRPDLTATGIVAAATAQIGLPVQIAASVRELNGDLGARAACALRVDGQTVDRATNIWVDANGNVSCVFLHTFATAGQKALEVVLEDVAPRDYDPSNNSVTATIEVKEQQLEPTSWHLYAAQLDGWSESRSWSIWGHLYEYRNQTWQTDVQLGVVRDNTVINMETMQLRYSEVSDGQTVLAMDPVPLQLFPLVRSRQCGRMLLPDDTMEILVCQRFKSTSVFDRIPSDMISVTIRRESRDVTYYSHESAPAMDGYPGYETEVYGTYTQGPQGRYGNTISFDIELTDGTYAMELHKVLPFEVIDYPYYESSWCSPTWCQESRGAGVTKYVQAFQ